MAIIRRIHAPLLTPEDAIPHLGAPHHWKEGRSAKSLIDQWWSANAIPQSVKLMLDQAPEWRGADLVDAFVERCTDLSDGRPSHSQSDLLAIVGIVDRLGVLAVEAKVDEGFDKTVDEWRSGSSAGKEARLQKLCALFGLDPQAVGHLRYQLFHRTASAIIEAKRYRVRQAAMIVQSWSSARIGLDDFRAFFAAIGLPDLRDGEFSTVIMIDDVALRTGWVTEPG
ncbi:hypothetical protein FPZ24_01555 [Sphingomonas panacisoli]|uniref:DUF6946 domain-containing protein n=1 Tax=Sphingomonas panacisoli TaxID=1813879 RepID=A0A5B8LEF2_9SPHN|nr:hypothetical protein [Sphingomonas panacisoli]QDZ06316.1 hypothetical protein FPZ24_01555 [Sphingomonas panacisoli]